MLMASLLADSLKNANFAVETAPDAATARKAIKTFDPDIMLIDIFLGAGPNGIQLANVVSQTNPEIGLLILTKYQDSLSAANDLGQLPENCGFLRKDMVSDTSYLVSAIEAVLSDHASEVRQDMAIGKSVADLNEKQTQVLRLLAEGFTNAEIASRTELSVKSVERYLAQTFDLLDIHGEDGVNQRVEAARRYYLAAGIPERS